MIPAPPSRSVCRPLSRHGAVALLILLAGCGSSALRPPLTGYTCCNLRADAGWISSDNLLGTEVIPVGELVKIDAAKGAQYLYGTIGARGIGLRHDAAKTRDDTVRWARRVVVPDDPRPQVAAWSAEIRAAVDIGRVMVGMNRVQVAVALGYPSPTDTPELLASTWRYRTLGAGEHVDLKFSEEGKLLAFAGNPAAIRAVELQRPAAPLAAPASVSAPARTTTPAVLRDRDSEKESPPRQQ
jgi:hypothetical protein